MEFWNDSDWNDHLNFNSSSNKMIFNLPKATSPFQEILHLWTFVFKFSILFEKSLCSCVKWSIRSFGTEFVQLIRDWMSTFISRSGWFSFEFLIRIYHVCVDISRTEVYTESQQRLKHLNNKVVCVVISWYVFWRMSYKVFQQKDLVVVKTTSGKLVAASTLCPF